MHSETHPDTLSHSRTAGRGKGRLSGGYWATVGRRIRRDPVTMFCGTVLLLIIAGSLVAPLIAPADPYKTSMLRRLAAVGTHGYPLGSDELGRDMLTRLLYGGRLSLLLGLSPVVGAL